MWEKKEKEIKFPIIYSQVFGQKEKKLCICCKKKGY